MRRGYGGFEEYALLLFPDFTSPLGPTEEHPRGLQPLTSVTVIEELPSSQMGIYLERYCVRPTGHPADDLLKFIGAASQVRDE